ncbi:MAG TPA: hypothetical protein VHI10_13480, partial [Mycobacterium sp.]|nr:hypothetical protein [Mycobacterium sp.]
MGGLAVALGVGVAAVTGYGGGVAWADTPASSESSSAESSESSADDASSTSSGDASVSEPDTEAD